MRKRIIFVVRQLARSTSYLSVYKGWKQTFSVMLQESNKKSILSNSLDEKLAVDFVAQKKK